MRRQRETETEKRHSKKERETHREIMQRETEEGGTSLVAQWLRICLLGFPGGAVLENLPANAGDTGSSPGLGRSHMPWSN